MYVQQWSSPGQCIRPPAFLLLHPWLCGWVVSNKLVRFSNDSLVVGLITNNNNSQEVDVFFSLNVSKVMLIQTVEQSRCELHLQKVMIEQLQILGGLPYKRPLCSITQTAWWLFQHPFNHMFCLSRFKISHRKLRTLYPEAVDTH